MAKNKLLKTMFGAARTAIKTSLRHHVLDEAAALSFYMMFSLFPLLLLFVVASTFFLDKYQTQVIDLLLSVFPASSWQFLRESLLILVKKRGSMGIVGIATLLWSILSTFGCFVRNIQMASQQHRATTLINNYLQSALLIAFLFAVLIIVLVSKTLTPMFAHILPHWEWLSAYNWLINGLLTLFPLVLLFGVFAALYFYSQSPQRSLRSACLGAIIASLGCIIATNGLAFLIHKDMLQYQNFVYGSIGTLLALLCWFYSINIITLYAAHLTAALARSDAKNSRRHSALH